MKAIALLLALAALCPGQDQPPVDWIRNHAIPLDTVAAGNGFADLQALKKTIGDARIVSLGEATHGTREFFQMKHRMLEFLATEMGFNIFAIEANMPEAYRLNDYVLRGEGDAAKLLRGMYFWTWDTEEVLEMIRWMREFNASGKGRVQFTGFDMQTTTVAAQIVDGLLGWADPGFRAQAAAAADLVERQRRTNGYAVTSLIVPPGREMRISGFVKTDQISRGAAGLGCAIYDSQGRMVAYESRIYLRGTAEWTSVEIALRVPAGATNAYVGAYHAGDGTAWFDSLRVEVDGFPYATAQDWGFEAGARGFSRGGTGYSVDVDTAVAHTGRQSLRMRSFGPPARDVALAAQYVVEHMEGSREIYRSMGAAEEEVEWAIQNARIVAQAAESAYDGTARDKFMAQNAKWILDRNPGGKMVIWAHNLHIAAGGVEALPVPMGRVLREWYGREMVTFGFAFDQGSFQAIGPAGLGEFTVGPAPGDSLDGVLAATGIPMFVLPFGEDLPDWLRRPQMKREIGATFRDEMASAQYPIAAPAAWDALIFVERTTRARPNP